jgi:hypothetical protein
MDAKSANSGIDKGGVFESLAFGAGSGGGTTSAKP